MSPSDIRNRLERGLRGGRRQGGADALVGLSELLAKGRRGRRPHYMQLTQLAILTEILIRRGAQRSEGRESVEKRVRQLCGPDKQQSARCQASPQSLHNLVDLS